MTRTLLIEFLSLFFLICFFSKWIVNYLEKIKTWLFDFPKGHLLRKLFLFIALSVAVPFLFVSFSKTILISYLKPDITVKSPLYAIPLRVLKLCLNNESIDRMDYIYTNRKNIEETFSHHRIQNPKKEGEFRIVVLGNSIGYGAFEAYPDVFSTLLEKRLQQEGIPVQIYNLAMHGATPLETLTLLHLALEKKIDCVLWAASYRECADAYNKGIEVLPHTDIPYLIKNKLIPPEKEKELLDPKLIFYRKIKSLFPFFQHSDSFKAMLHAGVIRYFNALPKSMTSPLTQKKAVLIPFNKTLQKFLELCEVHSVKILTIYFPAPESIMKEEMKKDFDRWKGKNMPFNFIDQTFTSSNQKENYDLTEIIPRELLYDGFHMNKEGNIFVADFLYPKLKQIYFTHSQTDE